MTRLSTLQLQPLISRLEEAALVLDGESYWQAWQQLNDCREAAQQANLQEISQWIFEKITRVHIPRWIHMTEKSKEVDTPRFLTFYDHLLMTMHINDRNLLVVMGMDEDIDRRAIAKINLNATQNTADTASFLRAAAPYLTPKQRTQALHQLIQDVATEARSMPLEYQENNAAEARKSRASSSIRTTAHWLLKATYDDIEDHQGLCTALLDLYENHLGDCFQNLTNQVFDQLCKIGMEPLARKMLVRQQAHNIEVKQVMERLIDPQPDEVFACIMKEAIGGEGIHQLFGLLFNHPDRKAVKTQLETLRLKGTGLQINIGKTSSFEKMAWHCGSWARHAHLNTAEQEGISWWANGMLERLKAEKQCNVERNIKLLSGLLANAGMSIEQQMAIEPIHKRSRLFLESDLDL